MSQIQFERIWIAQCAAARRVKNRFGLANALDYLIGEKLLNFTQVAERRAEFMQELPDFLQEIRAVFSLEETSDYATQLESTRQPVSALRPPGFGASSLKRAAQETALDLNSQPDLGRRPYPIKEMRRVRWPARLQPLHRVRCPSASSGILHRVE
jgi:hypothetical protein